MTLLPRTVVDGILQCKLAALVAQTNAGSPPTPEQLARAVPPTSLNPAAAAVAIGLAVAAEAARLRPKPVTPARRSMVATKRQSISRKCGTKQWPAF